MGQALPDRLSSFAFILCACALALFLILFGTLTLLPILLCVQVHG